MKYLYIFVLFLIACSDVTIDKCTPFEVTISDALPIQFWLNDCDTYNEKEVCGVHHRCWCQPWNCDDELVIQFSDEVVSDYILRVLNSEGETLEDIEFLATEFTEDPFADLPFTSWTNVPSGDGNSWNIDSDPDVSVSASGATEISDYLRRPMVLSPGTYDIAYNWTPGGTGSIRLQFRKDGVSIGEGSVSTLSSTGTVSVTITDESDEFIIYLRVTAFNTASIILNQMLSITDVLRDPIFTANYTPSQGSPSVCGEQIRFEIIEVGTSPENIVAKSDCIDVRNSHDCTTEIEYTNNRNFAGLVYENVSPVTTFKTLVPAIFFHERFPEEDNVIELSDAIIKTSGQVKAQRLFETDYMPYYMHRKLKLILKHQTVLIDNQYWTKEESYDVQDGERRWPVKKGKCFLTEKNYVQRAVL